MWISILIFAGAYVLIAVGHLHKTAVALLAAVLLLSLHAVDTEVAYAAVDLNVIFLLVGMMVLVHIISKTGFFQWVALALSLHAGGDPIKILVYLMVATGVLSALLDNVTTVLLFAPVTILIADQLEVNVVPYLVLEALASNVGGTATLIGDPPNILIGSRVGLSFNAFVVNLGPIIFVCLLVLALAVRIGFRGAFHVPEHVRARLRDIPPNQAIVDPVKLRRVGIVMGFVLVGFVLHGPLGIEPSAIALAGAMLAVVVTGEDMHEVFERVEWPTLMFFVGLFILVAGLQEHGVLATVARAIAGITQGHFFLTVMVVLWGSAFASAIVDNIPFVAAMIPVIQALIPDIAADMGMADTAMAEQVVAQPMWWALALGACLGGNGTLLGASANVVIAGVAEQHGHPITFWYFLRYGLPTTICTLLLSSVYLYLRFFAF